MKGRMFTISNIYLINGIIHYLSKHGRTTYRELFDNQRDTIKSGKAEHMERVRMLSNMANSLGLVDGNTGDVWLSEAGIQYAGLFGEDRWRLSDAQKVMVRDYIIGDTERNQFVYSINTLIGLSQRGLDRAELKEQFCTAIGKDKDWKKDITKEGFLGFGLNYLSELGFNSETSSIRIKDSNSSVIRQDHSKTSTKRNPKWARDELILALDLYFRVSPLHTSEKHPEIVQLSELLNSLPIHPRFEKDERFRNPDGVYMKLCNFLRFDPEYKGKGLGAGSKLDAVVWNEFYSDRRRLAETAESIKRNYRLISPPQTNSLDTEAIDEDEEFPEGKIISRIHRLRERNAKLVNKKKQQVLKAYGTLACEVCEFDFAVEYGDIGLGFAECHHNVPISRLLGERKVRLSELSIVCANCHRMIHRTRPWLSVKGLKALKENK